MLERKSADYFIEVFITNKVTMHTIGAPIDLLHESPLRTILILLIQLKNFSCLLFLYGSCLIFRSALSFPTARSIFTLPAVYIYKIVPYSYGENALRYTRRSVVGKRHLTFKLLTDCVRISMIVSVFFGNGIALRRAVRTVRQCE